MPTRDLTEEEAKRLASGPLSFELAKMARKYAAPVFWSLPKVNEEIGDHFRNGTTFFMDHGSGVFGVTAAHVYDGFAEAAAEGARCRIGRSPLMFDLRERLKSRGRNVDIATYRIAPDEIRLTEATVLSGCESSWPPAPPARNQGVFYAGYPGLERKALECGCIEFGRCFGFGLATSISPRDVSSVIEREDIVPVSGMALPPLSYDFAGMSGAPMLTLVETGVLSWRLAGVIYECGRELGEIVKAARADFIDQAGEVLG